MKFRLAVTMLEDRTNPTGLPGSELPPPVPPYDPTLPPAQQQPIDPVVSPNPGQPTPIIPPAVPVPGAP